MRSFPANFPIEKLLAVPNSQDGSGNATSGLAVGVRMGVEMVVATFLGGGLGYLADGYLQTLPWFTVLGVLLGTVAGIRNVLRMGSTLNDKRPPK